MNRAKLIAGIIWLVLGAMMVIGLIGLIQRLLISGTAFIDQMGGMIIVEEQGEEMEIPEPTIDPEMLMFGDDFEVEPMITMEPEELFSIPVEQTAEELAKENEKPIGEE